MSTPLLYVALFFPTFVMATAAAGTTAAGAAVSGGAIAVMALGLVVETVADFQKSWSKEAAPGTFAKGGLYAWSRHPNFFGEVVFWTASVVAAVPFFHAWYHWVVAPLGAYVMYFIVAKGAAKKLDMRQNEKYKDEPGYAEYLEKVPLLVPLVGKKGPAAS
mmetsp:Transcript_13159/g.33373  ORF Transcript_13159/g.33373 Transcript_13159/m.33373 type:complete len:161 (-) Transcript_13159:487-969(-)